MVHAVEHEVEELAPFALRFVMENPAVHGVFDEAPDQNPGDEQARDDAERQGAPHRRDVEHVTHQRQVDDKRSCRMHVRKELHEIALEHADRFVLVGDKALRHSRYHA